MRRLIAWFANFAEQLRICDVQTALQELQEERMITVTRLAELRIELRRIDGDIALLEKALINEAKA